jgi:transposase, IS5 family
MPSRSSKIPQRRLLELKRRFREALRWRSGCEGRISPLKRRHGLNHCRDKGEDGTRRGVGLVVIADNLINIGQALNAADAE